MTVVGFPVTVQKAKLARDLYDALRCHARDHSHMGKILSDMLMYKTRDNLTKDIVILMVMIHKDREGRP